MDRAPFPGHGVSSKTAHGPASTRSTGASGARKFDDVPRVSGGVLARSQRESPRRAPSCRALISNGSSYQIPQAIHDISLVGLFVELEHAAMVLGDMVEIVLEFDGASGAIDLQLSAEVVRIEHNGIGLRFSHYNNQTYTDLVNLLYARGLGADFARL